MEADVAIIPSACNCFIGAKLCSCPRGLKYVTWTSVGHCR